MVANYPLDRPLQTGQVIEVTFAGDNVCLAGQIDYPDTEPPTNGYPLVFMLHHAGANTRADYRHYARIALDCGYAVFRWDKRGTGRSGAGGRGSITQDAVMAYKNALEQPDIDLGHVVILAQCAGTALLGESFPLFAEVQPPRGVLLASNLLDASSIQAIEAPVCVVMGEEDWNDWQTYARDACENHNSVHDMGAVFYIAPEANRMLMVETEGHESFHDGARDAIQEWLQSI